MSDTAFVLVFTGIFIVGGTFVISRAEDRARGVVRKPRPFLRSATIIMGALVSLSIGVLALLWMLTR